jgi:Immunoglobulin I-set domain
LNGGQSTDRISQKIWQLSPVFTSSMEGPTPPTRASNIAFSAGLAALDRGSESIPFLSFRNPWFWFLRLFVVLDWRAGISLLILLTASGCGGGPGGVAPNFTIEPTALSTPVGQIATFTVTASGSAPLRFQWSKNGTEINGATNSSYTTPAVVPADNGSSFNVTVTNSIGSATSSSASLTVLPRSPQLGDWRFQGMDLPAGSLAGATDLVSFETTTLPNVIGTPLEVGLQFGDSCGSSSPNDCAWNFFGFNSPNGAVGPTTVYMSDSLDNLASDLNTMNNGSSVVTSLDLEPVSQIFACGALQISQMSGFEFSSQTVSIGQLQTIATQLGEQSRVITAVSYDADGNVFVVSYGWQSDATTGYSTQAVIIPSNSTSVATADSNVIATAITNLANQGYIITATGGNASNGLLIIGTRVQGDTLPRPIEVFQQTGHQGQVSATAQSVWGTVGGTTPSFFLQFSEQ